MLKPNSVCCCVLAIWGIVLRSVGSIFCISSLAFCHSVYNTLGFVVLRSHIVLQKLGLAQMFINSSFQLLQKSSSISKANVWLFFFLIEISDFSHKVSSYLLRFVSSIQGIKFSQNPQSYIHLHQNDNAKPTHTAFLRTGYCKKIAFFLVIVVSKEIQSFQMAFQVLFVQLHYINLREILRKKLPT